MGYGIFINKGRYRFGIRLFKLLIFIGVVKVWSVVFRRSLVMCFGKEIIIKIFRKVGVEGGIVVARCF